MSTSTFRRGVAWLVSAACAVGLAMVVPVGSAASAATMSKTSVLRTVSVQDPVHTVAVARAGAGTVTSVAATLSKPSGSIFGRDYLSCILGAGIPFAFAARIALIGVTLAGLWLLGNQGLRGYVDRVWQSCKRFVRS